MKKYTTNDIKVLSDRDHVRLRTSIYLGNTSECSYKYPLFINDNFDVTDVIFVPAVYKSINEIIENAIDEILQINSKNKIVTITYELGKFTITDNGRGIPIDKHETGKFTPEVALGSLRAGRNFIDNKEVGVIGQNGVGAACVNYLSKEFSVVINRDGKLYQQQFYDGANKISKPSITKGPKRTGTSISFVLDDSVLNSVAIPENMLENRAMELAFTNPGVTVSYNKKNFKYKKGLEDVVKNVIEKNLLDTATYTKFEYNNGTCQMEFYVIFGINRSVDEEVFTWVNSSMLFDGGILNTQFMNTFIAQTITYLSKQAKRDKIEINRNDVRRNMLVLGSAKISDPVYDAQSKLRLTGPDLKKEINVMIESGWKAFVRQNKLWLEEVLSVAAERHHSAQNKKAVKNHQKTLKKKIKGLVDATNRTRYKCSLFITEGLSAASQIVDVREPALHGSLPLTGKINNVYGLTPAQLLEKGKITDLLTAIGLIPGKRASIGELRYGKIILATDSDIDGGDIFCLLVNAFYHFWPELFDPNKKPIVFRLIAPNVVVSKGKTRIHYPSLAEYKKHVKKYDDWAVEYMKGLGSMWKSDWQMLIKDLDNYLIPIQDDGKMDTTLELLFSDNVNARKEWLQ